MSVRGHFGLMMAGAAVPPSDDLWAQYSIERVRVGYTGPCLKARRSIDSATMDVGFDGSDELDTASLLAWSGSDSVFVERWYDQSGAGNDLYQATTTKQPRIVNAGTPDGFVRFDGTDDWMGTVNTSGSGLPAVTIAMRAWSRASVDGTFVQKSLNINTYNGFYILSLSTDVVRLGVSDPVSGSGQFTAWNATSNAATSEAVWVVRYDRSLSTASNRAAWRRAWRNGTEQTIAFVATSGNGGASTTFADNAYYIGARASDSTLAGQVNFKTLQIFHASKDADVAAITAAI